MSSYAEIVTELAVARVTTGLSTRIVSADAGVGNSMVSVWESGSVEPSAPNLIKWAGALGYDIELVKREAS